MTKEQGQWIRDTLNMVDEREILENQKKTLEDMLKVTRICFESGRRNLELFQRQAEKTIDMTVKHTQELTHGVDQTVSSWMETVKNAQVSYLNTIEEGLRNLEHLSANIAGDKPEGGKKG